MANQTNTNTRANQMQFLRFLAFTLIFLWHADVYSFSWFPHDKGAALAVSFFFILSGAVTGYSHYNSDITFSLHNILGISKKRLYKIYPLYFITTLYTISYNGYASRIANHEFSSVIISGLKMSKNFLLLQSWYPASYFSYNGVGWFLSTILFLYLLENPLLSIASKIKKRSKNILFFTFIIIFSATITTLYCFLMRNNNLEFWLYIFPPSRLGEYISGICLGYIVQIILSKYSNSTTRYKYLFTIIEILSLVLWLSSTYSHTCTWTYWIIHWLLPNYFVIFIFLLGKGHISDFFKNIFFQRLGDISFECFLLHQILIHEYTVNNPNLPVNIGTNIFSLLFCYTMVIIIANFLYTKRLTK